MKIPRLNINRRIGAVLAVLFGLALFFEVAVLPLVSSCAVDIEKTLIAEFVEQDETEIEKSFDFLESYIPSTAGDFDSYSLQSLQQIPTRAARLKRALHHEPSFILLHSFRI